MARTTAPLLGFEASGQIGKTMVYGKWRGVRYSRRYVIPANPRTVAQTTTRTTFSKLREIWKVLPAVGRAPWDSFATGRQFLGLNAFIGENMRVIRGDADMDDFIGSPGARGGLAPSATLIAQGSGTGEIDITLTNPTLPAGWTFESANAIAFPQQDPAVDFVLPMKSGTELVANTLFTLTGFTTALACVCAAWLILRKPNGELAYSVGVTSAVTAGV